MSTKVCFSIALLLFLGHFSQAQIRVRAELDKVNRKIIIDYDLIVRGGKYDTYSIQLYLSEDGGSTFGDPLEYVLGNVGRGVRPGTGKKIEWLYFKERPDFGGENVVFKVTSEVDEKARDERIMQLGDTKSAFLSLAFPGWGTYKVTPGKKLGLFGTGVAAYSFLGAGVWLRLRADDNFEKYLKAESIQEGDELFDRAENQELMSNVFLITAGVIWVTDFTIALIRGKRNRAEQQRIILKRINARAGLNYDPLTSSPLLSLRLRF